MKLLQLNIEDSSQSASDKDWCVSIVNNENESPNDVSDENGDPKYLFGKLGNTEKNIRVDTGSLVSLIT